tara:strand:- start:246 stop:728 length:483 start_codon:yes stop_codon:yes gene_type:complete
MIKIIIVILFIFNSLACEPIQQASDRENIQRDNSFVCLTSQSQCGINTKFGRFNIQFSGEALQQSIKTELPFQIQLTLNAVNEAYQLKSISSYLEGKTMFMGKIPIFFQINKTNSMVAESLLASCSEEGMTWRLWFQIEILADGKIHQQDFFIDFDSQRL